MIVVETKNAKVEWIAEERVIIKTFFGYIHDDELREVFDSGLKKLSSEKGKKWLSDNRNLKPYKQEDKDWINNNWLPRAITSGWKYWAIIEPEGAIGNMSMRQFISFFAEKGIELKTFKTPEEGRAWLKTKIS